MQSSTRRRWFQFSTLGLLALMVLVALGMKFVPRGAFRQPTNCIFVDTPVSDVLDYLSNKYHYVWRSDDAALAAAGIDLDRCKVTNEAEDISLGDTLERFLAPHRLGTYIDHGELVLTTRPAAQEAFSGLGALRQRFAQLNPRPN